MIRLGLVVTIFVAALPFFGCGSAAGYLPPPQPPKVTVATPIAREVLDFDEFTGRIEAEQNVEVRARVSGHLLEIYFNDGDFVKEGDPLFLIDPSTYQAEYDQAVAKINLWDAKQKFAKAVRVRNESLVAKNAVSREEFEQSIASENEALAAMKAAEADAARAKLNLDFTKVVSPINGRIDRRYVTKGNLVESGPAATLLTTIISIDPIYIYFNPDELAFLKYTASRVEEGVAMDVAKLKARNMQATIVLADGRVHPDKGTIDFAANRLDPATGTIQVRALFRNERRALAPGLFVRVQVAPEKAYPALLVAERAIGTDQSDKFVYVLDAKNAAQRRIVQLGTKHGRLRVVKSGLAASDRVVISGTLLVRPGQEVVPTDGQMEEESPGTSSAVIVNKPVAASEPPPTKAAPAHSPLER